MITGNRNVTFNAIFKRVLKVCYLLWKSAASTASEKALHFFHMPIAADCCGLQWLTTFVDSSYLYHVICVRTY